jgi:iron complex outermembrane recepter protein
MTRRYLPMWLAIGGVMLLCALQPVAAQVATTGAGYESLQEVTVTARRVEENVQVVPESVIVISPGELQAAQIQNLYDLVKLTPGLATCCSESTLGGGLWIRGIQGGNTYFGGGPLSGAIQTAFFDSSGVQVLEGPQGTLFGLNNTSGAVVVEPRAPANNNEGYVHAETGNFGHEEIEGAINIPLVSDKVLLRVGAQIVKTDGYIQDLQSGQDIYNQNYWIARATLTVNFSDALHNRTLVNYFYRDENSGVPIAIPIQYYNLNGPTVQIALGRGYTFEGMNTLQLIAAQEALGPFKTLGTQVQGGLWSGVKQTNVVNTTDLAFNDKLSLKNILSFQSLWQNSRGDWALSPLPILANCPSGCLANGPQITYSDELQLLGKLFDDKLSYIVGTFNQVNQTSSPYNIQYQVTLGIIDNGTTTQTSTRTNGIYVNGNYDLSSWLTGLSATAGYRFGWDKSYNGTCNYTGAGAFVACLPQETGSWEDRNYILGVQYKINNRSMVYLTNSTGSLAGGFNSATLPAQFREYAPETLNEIELGVKSDYDLGGVGMRTNLAIWHGWYTGIQLSNTAISNTGQFLVYVSNNGRGFAQGAEGQLAVRPIHGLELFSNFVFSNNHLTNYSVQGVDRTSQPFIYDPKWTYNVGVTATLPIPPSLGRLSATTTYDFHDSLFAISTYPVLSTDAAPRYHNMGANVTWKDFWGKSGLDAVLAVTNLTNQYSGPGQFAGWSSLGVLGYPPARPRMVIVSLNYGF